MVELEFVVFVLELRFEEEPDELLLWLSPLSSVKFLLFLLSLLFLFFFIFFAFLQFLLFPTKFL